MNLVKAAEYQIWANDLIREIIDNLTNEEFAKNDPYVVNGLVTEWNVRPWTVVFGGE